MINTYINCSHYTNLIEIVSSRAGHGKVGSSRTVVSSRANHRGYGAGTVAIVTLMKWMGARVLSKV